MFINKFPDKSSHLCSRQNVGFIFKLWAVVPNNSEMCTLMEYACFANVLFATLHTSLALMPDSYIHKSNFNGLAEVQISHCIEWEINLLVKSNIFWNKTPCSPLKINRRFGGTYRLLLQGRRVSRQETSVKARGKKNKQTSVHFQLNTRRYIADDNTLYNHCWDPQILYNILVFKKSYTKKQAYTTFLCTW
jgi:hypothetical protein